MKLLGMLLEFLFPSRNAERIVRDATLESVGALVSAREHHEGLVSLLPYHRPLARSLIIEAKFRDSEKAHQLLGTILADYLREWIADRAALNPSRIVIVPVPLSRERRKERGYNQSERITREAERFLRDTTMDTTILQRWRDTLPQTSLNGDARRRNLTDAFIAQATDPSHTYIVIDDVMTTGSTLSSAIGALKQTGARNVYGVSLAH